MKRTLTAIAATLCAWAGLSTVQAQTDFTVPLNISLIATTEGAPGTNNGIVTQSLDLTRVSTSTVIAALGASLGSNFSRGAGLWLTESNSAIMVSIKDRTNAPVNVTAYFVFVPPTNTLDSVSAFSFWGGESFITTNVLGMETFGLVSPPGVTNLTLHFDVTGLSTTSYRVVDHGTNSSTSISLSASVSGLGDDKGQFALFQGSISAGGEMFFPVSPIRMGDDGGDGGDGHPDD